MKIRINKYVVFNVKFFIASILVMILVSIAFSSYVPISYNAKSIISLLLIDVIGSIDIDLKEDEEVKTNNGKRLL